MATLSNEKPRPAERDLYEDVSREDIVAAFRSAMIGHFRSHIPGTNINESTLLASDGEAVTLVAEVASELDGDAKTLHATCDRAAQRLRVLIDEANAIANGETVAGLSDSETAGDVGGHAAIDALFGSR